MQQYEKTTPINLEQFNKLSAHFIETEGEERLVIAQQLINLLKKESWRITGELIEQHRS